MPKSKRNKLVTLSKTEKKTRGHKESIVAAVRQCFDEYREMYVFEFENMRNSKFKELREELKSSSRFFLGANKVLQVALGRDEADAYRDGIHRISQLVSGNRGLLFTNLLKDDISRRIEDFEAHDFARVGSTATETVELKEGPLEQFTHDMEPFLRKQGMPVRLNKGVVELVADHVVCTEGQPVSPEASKILRLLGVQMAAFRLSLVARWTPSELQIFSSELPQGGKQEDAEEDASFKDDDAGE